MNVFLDYETWSSVVIGKGTGVYTDHARPLILQYAFDDGPLHCVDFTEDWDSTKRKLPADLGAAIWSSGTTRFIAHNAYFDRTISEKCLSYPPDLNWECTYVMALAHGLPGGLAPLCDVLGVPADSAKDPDGMRLIRKFCGPKPLPNRNRLMADPDWQKFVDYCGQDVIAMRECYRRMPRWNWTPKVKKLWALDWTINTRGFKIDRQFATETIKALSTYKQELAERTATMTNDEVRSATQRDKFLQFMCESQGCFLPDLTASTISQALEDESLDESTKELLKIRQDASKSSNSKYKRLADCAGPDDRLRYTLQFRGAGRTSRYAGRIFQPQNLPRLTMDLADVRNCVALIKEGRADLVDMFAPLTKASSNAIRSLIVASSGKKIVVNDWNAIEGRINAWIAGEEWKLQAFREDKDIYILLIERALGLAPGTVKKGDIRRQWGKVLELALGYAGGVGAFLNMAAVYNVDLDELAVSVPKNAPDAVLAKAEEIYLWNLSKHKDFGLAPATYIACESLKIMYREANPMIVKSWENYENAARKVISEPGTEIQVGPLVFDATEKWMRIRMPSGQYLSYANPKISQKGAIGYMAWRNKKWSRTKTYGGKFCENIVQKIALDVLDNSIEKLSEVRFGI